MSFRVEEIPDADRLFMRVHQNLAPDGEIHLNVFRDHGGRMSTDWSKYSTPRQTRERAPEPKKNGVLHLSVEDVRAIRGLSVVHEPLDDNQAHTGVFGEKDEEARMLLNRCARSKIPVPPIES